MILQTKNLLKLDPWFITGFTDAEGCFYIGVQKSSKVKLGWEIQLEFKIELHIRDSAILEDIQKYFLDKGQLILKNNAIYRVRSLKELELVINHFEKYPLITEKYADYTLFKAAYDIMKVKGHLTEEGFLEILSLKAAINLGMPDKLKEHFPNIIPSIRSEIVNRDIKNPNWLAGFATGEGCFLILTTKNTNSITLRFKLSQHIRDIVLMKYIEQYLECGVYYSANNNVGEYVVSKFLDIKGKILPFFDKYPIRGIKHLDYLDFKKAALLVDNKEHLTPKGYEKILLLKAAMNRGR